MPRNMSHALTTEQAYNKTKDVTRRDGWWFLKKGDIIQQVEKAMGLKKGEKIKKIHLVEVVSTYAEPLNKITQEDVIREGFPDWTPKDFVDFYVKESGCKENKILNRIEYKYLEAA